MQAAMNVGTGAKRQNPNRPMSVVRMMANPDSQARVLSACRSGFLALDLFILRESQVRSGGTRALRRRQRCIS